MQRTYITALYEIMQKDNRICSLLSDSGTDYDILMARDFPERCFNFGISEQNKIGAASGMAALGKIPFVYTTGAFLAYRGYEFIRDDVCFQKRNVKIFGMGTGFSGWCTLGVSHHSTEDISILRGLPGLVLLSASTPRQLSEMVKAAYEIEGPVYVRLGMSGEEELYDASYKYSIGKIDTIIEGKKVVVFSTGTILPEVFKAVNQLNAEGYEVSLVDVHTLNPIDEEGISKSLQDKMYSFTVEEHGIKGGLGGIVSEVMVEKNISVPLKKIGLKDSFAKGYGKTKEIRTINGLDSTSIYNQIKSELNN